MSYVVNEADVVRDREIMLDLLKNNRTRENFSYEKRFKWIYEENPDGKAIPWIIWEKENNIAVGFTAVFPRRILVNGEEKVCWNCGDFSIEPKYRSLGVALQLRKEAKKGVMDGEVPFLYAHPNDRMKVIHLRAGHQQLGCMHRYALPLRLDRYFRNKLKNEPLGKAVAFPFNQVIDLNLSLSGNKNLNAVLVDKPEFNDQHEELFLEFARKYSIIGVRDRVYLNWKYLENPNHHYFLMNFFSGDKRVGYVIFTKNDFVIEIVECIVFPDDWMKDVLAHFIRKIKRTFSDAMSVSVVTFETNPIIPILKQLKFQYRNDATTSVITFANPKSELDPNIYNKDSWYLSVGDRDA